MKGFACTENLTFWIEHGNSESSSVKCAWRTTQ